MHGFFNSEFTEIYADYLVKSVQAYAGLGIPIQYLTVQSEPATGGDRATPAAMWTWEQERDVLLAFSPAAARFSRRNRQARCGLLRCGAGILRAGRLPCRDGCQSSAGYQRARQKVGHLIFLQGWKCEAASGVRKSRRGLRATFTSCDAGGSAGRATRCNGRTRSRPEPAARAR